MKGKIVCLRVVELFKFGGGWGCFSAVLKDGVIEKVLCKMIFRSDFFYFKGKEEVWGEFVFFRG